jgi:hypothetical protein
MPYKTPSSPVADRRQRSGRQSRRCLSCSQWFSSAGGGERVCEACKAGEDWADAVAACHGHIAW